MRRAAGVVGWLLAVVAIALGAAGLVTAIDAAPGEGGRPELTAAGDAEVTVALDAAQAELEALAADVEALGTQARGALAGLTANDRDTVAAAIAEGDGLVARIDARSLAVGLALGDVPLLDTPAAAYQVSQGVRERRDRLLEALEATIGLEDDWARLTTGSVTASRMSELLAAHDEAVLAAAALGRQGKYDEAIATLGGADTAIADARALRDRLARTVDVTTLDAWLDRNAAYDTALRGLYRALRDVGGRVTQDVRDAVKAERAAKERLPPDSRAMVLIMADIGRGGMNEAVIGIEEARGRLAEALEPASAASPTVAP
jgi:hypothetical protein